MEPAAMGIIPHMKPALYRAAAAGTLKQYLEEGAEDCQLTQNGNTVLHVAVLHGNKHFVEQILQQQRAHPVAASSSMLFARNNKNETVLHCAAEKGDADILSALINAIKEYDTNDLESDVGVIEMIHMPDVVNDMALHKATRMGHLGVVKKLLIEDDNGFLYPTNNVGETPIYLAAESHFFYCLKAILACKNLTYVGPFGRNPLHAAILSSGTYTLWEKLMQNFGRHMDKANMIGPLWEKLMQNFGRHVDKARCIQLLLNKEEISLCEMSDSLGWTPLHYAVKLGDDETVRKILKKQSSAAYIRAGIDNDDWTTIFHIAARHGNIKTMKCISNCIPDCWAMINCKFQNVLHEAILSGRGNIVKYILKYPQIDNLVDQKDNNGNTPLHLFSIISWTKYDHGYILTRLERKHLVFNKRHQAPLDLRHVASQSEVYSAFMHVSGGIPQRSGRRSGPRADLFQNQETSREDTDNDTDKEINTYLRLGKTMTLVATLILTVSFSAGFTVPGGYDSEKGHPILLRDPAFGHFLSAANLAFICSALGISSYMIMVVLVFWASVREVSIVRGLCAMNMSMTSIASTAVVAAFLNGMYAIVAPIDTLATGIIFLSAHLLPFALSGYYFLRKYAVMHFSIFYLLHLLLLALIFNSLVYPPLIKKIPQMNPLMKY